MEQVEFPG
jgi:hypothetical protein